MSDKEIHKQAYLAFKDENLTFIKWLRISMSHDFFRLVFKDEYNYMNINRKKELINKYIKE